MGHHRNRPDGRISREGYGVAEALHDCAAWAEDQVTIAPGKRVGGTPAGGGLTRASAAARPPWQRRGNRARTTPVIDEDHGRIRQREYLWALNQMPMVRAPSCGVAMPVCIIGPFWRTLSEWCRGQVGLSVLSWLILDAALCWMPLRCPIGRGIGIFSTLVTNREGTRFSCAFLSAAACRKAPSTC